MEMRFRRVQADEASVGRLLPNLKEGIWAAAGILLVMFIKKERKKNWLCRKWMSELYQCIDLMLHCYRTPAICQCHRPPEESSSILVFTTLCTEFLFHFSPEFVFFLNYAGSQSTNILKINE